MILPRIMKFAAKRGVGAMIVVVILSWEGSVTYAGHRASALTASRMDSG